MDNKTDINTIILDVCTKHEINLFFRWLKIRQHDHPIENIILDTLKYRYNTGYKQFAVKEWGKKIKIDYKDKRHTKAYFKLIKSMYDLCKECHTLQDISGVKIPFNNAYRWFASSLLELILDDLFALIKNKELDNWQTRLKKLKSLDYPAKINEDIKYNPFLEKYSLGLALLIESAQSIGRINTTFENNYWKPFLNAIESVIKTLKSTDVDLVAGRFDGIQGTMQFKKNGRGRFSKKKYQIKGYFPHRTV